MRDLEEQKADAYDMHEAREIAAGKALLPECPECGFWMQANPKQNGRTWVCGSVDCGYTEFEEVKR